MMRQAWISNGDAVSVAQQCVLAGVSRATVYAHQKPKPVDESDLLLSRLIDCEYTGHPFYGSRKMEALRSARQSVIKARCPQLIPQDPLRGVPFRVSDGGYSYQQIVDYLGMYFTTVGKIVTDSRGQWEYDRRTAQRFEFLLKIYNIINKLC